MTAFLRWFFGLFGIPYGCYAKFPQHGSEVIGYGWVNNWMRLSGGDLAKLAAHMFKNNLNTVMIEFYGYGRDEHCQHPGDLLSALEHFISVFYDYRIAVWITFINWNVGDGDHPENGKIGPCDERYNLHTLASICGMCYERGWQDGVIIEPAAEWHQGKCAAKAHKLHDWIGKNCSGLKAWNEDSRPGSAPVGWILDYHIDRPGALGASCENKVIVTDTSHILNWLGGLHDYANNLDNLRHLVGECRRRNFGFILYGFDSPGVDWRAIEVIGER